MLLGVNGVNVVNVKVKGEKGKVKSKELYLRHCESR